MTLFLSALFGFFVLLVLVLVSMLQVLLSRTEEIALRQWRSSAEIATRTLNQIDTASGPSTIEAALVGLRTDLTVAAIVVQTRFGVSVRSGEAVPEASEILEASTGLGEVTYYFDRSSLDQLRERFAATAMISLTAALGGAILLLLYIRRIARPIEALLAQAETVQTRDRRMDETHYLIETFRSTIATLREQEKELKELHNREKSRADDLERVTATLTRSLTSGFIALDPEGTLVEMNEAARNILGCAPPHSGQTTTALLGENDFSRTLVDAALHRTALNRHEVSLTLDGNHKTVGVTTVPLTNEAGRYLGLLALFTDLTPIRDLETRVREMRALADLGEVSAGIAHEFRNSLSTILGYLKLAKRTALAPDAEARVGSAMEEANSLTEAVTALLHFARPIEPVRDRVPLRPLLETLVERLKPYAGDRVSLRIQGTDAEILADSALLGRAFENILRNAIEAVQRSGRNGEVLVTVGENNTVVIDDDGVGVDPGEIPTLFLPFRSGRPGGFGLGLALSKKIVLLHEGSIVMEPRAPRGTRVRVHLQPAG